MHGLTQQQVADRWSELWPDPERPKSHKQISYWETGERQPGRDSLNKLAFLYCCSAGVLLGGEDYSHLDPAAHDGASSVTDFIPTKHVYPPILDALGAAHS